MNARPTRFNDLGYRQDAPGIWRFVDMSTDAVIGPAYRTKLELLANAEQFARDRGFTGDIVAAHDAANEFDIAHPEGLEPRPRRLSAPKTIRVIVPAGQWFRGVTHYQDAAYDLSPHYAHHVVRRGVARFAEAVNPCWHAVTQIDPDNAAAGYKCTQCGCVGGEAGSCIGCGACEIHPLQ
jgi:hypothetical protein